MSRPPENAPRSDTDIDTDIDTDTGLDLDDERDAAALERLDAILPPLPAGVFAPEEIGEVRLLEVVGGGGQGVVYRGEQKFTRRIVAVKLEPVPPGSRAVLAFVDRAVLASRIPPNPRLVTLHDAGVDPDHSLGYLVMEYVDGPDLREWLDQQPKSLPPRVVARVALGVAEGLVILHDHDPPIAHLDLKPSNVLMDPRPDAEFPWEPRLVDYGLASSIAPDLPPASPPGSAAGGAVASASGPARSSHPSGTPPYIAPERFRNPAADPLLSDVYALGVILVELAAGGDVPPPLAWIVRDASAHDPDYRYHSVKAVADDLRAFLDNRPVLGARARRRAPRRSLPRLPAPLRPRAFASIASIVALAVLAALAVALSRDRFRGRPESPPRPAAATASAAAVGTRAGAALADTSPLPPKPELPDPLAEYRLDDTPSSSRASAFAPTAARAPDGRHVVVWFLALPDQPDSEPALHVRARLFRPDGAPEGPSFPVAVAPAARRFRPVVTLTGDVTQSAGFPVVAMTSSGQFVVVWPDEFADGSGWGLSARRFAPDGTPLGAVFRVNERTEGHQIAPSVAIADNGDFTVVWQSHPPRSPDAPDVLVRRFPADAPPRPERRATLAAANWQHRPSVAVRPDGLAVLAWQSYGQPRGSAEDMYVRIFDSEGRPRAGEIRANDEISGDQVNYTARAVAVNSSGRFVVVWNRGSENPDQIRARVFPTDAWPASPDVLVDVASDSGPRAVAANPRVAIDEQGRFLVVWQVKSPRSNAWSVRARRFDPEGNPETDELRVTEDDSSLSAPDILIGPDGDALVLWQRISAPTAPATLHARRLPPPHPARR